MTSGGERRTSRGPVQRHPEIAFIVLALLFSWALWVPVILSARGILPIAIHANPLGSFGPAFSAIVVTWIIAGHEGVREITGRFRRLGASPGRVLGFVILPVAMFAISTTVHSLIQREVPRVANLDQWYLLIPLVPVILVLGGPLGEEIGWRGFLLPRLQSRFTPVVTSVLIAAAWLVWHLPLFWMEGAAQKGSSIGAFALTVIAFSMLFTWVFNGSCGSLWPVILFHTSINTVGFIFPTIFPSVDESKIHGLLILVVITLVALAAVALTRGSLGFENTNRTLEAKDREGIDAAKRINE